MTANDLRQALAEAERGHAEGDQKAFPVFQGKCMAAVILMLERLERLERILEIAPRGLG